MPCIHLLYVMYIQCICIAIPVFTCTLYTCVTTLGMCMCMRVYMCVYVCSVNSVNGIQRRPTYSKTIKFSIYGLLHIDFFIL